MGKRASRQTEPSESADVRASLHGSQRSVRPHGAIVRVVGCASPQALAQKAEASTHRLATPEPSPAGLRSRRLGIAALRYVWRAPIAFRSKHRARWPAALP